eukprot:TRINITY_DN56655_c0_g1_i1.p1 TRINITY_DN56655_c0_g1~~TRINITY_DN56655_c0_g1_i1.p1  ORF type:complete len:111 (-),score=12.25 TRINITY_DN56655_c0_g1_i1:120-452(-)
MAPVSTQSNSSSCLPPRQSREQKKSGLTSLAVMLGKENIWHHPDAGDIDSCTNARCPKIAMLKPSPDPFLDVPGFDLPSSPLIAMLKPSPDPFMHVPGLELPGTAFDDLV